MGSSAVKIQGYPKNLVRGSDFGYSPGCGGSGGGVCYNPAGFRYMWWRIYPSGFTVKNRRLILQNISFKSYLDAGFDGICSHSNGASQNYDVLLCYQPPTNDIQPDTNIKYRRTVNGSASLPFYLDFNEFQIPQPSDSAWGGLVYVVIDLGTTGRMVDGRLATDTAMKTTNFDFDERL